MTVNALTQQRLRELLDYCPETGVFTRRTKKGHERSGDVAGYRDTHGYIKLSVDYKRYYAHRLAWLWITGVWPPQIDHINRDRADNRLENLRVATPAQNAANRVA